MSNRVLSPDLETLLNSLSQHPEDIDKLVEDAIAASGSHLSQENRRSQWELLLRNEIYRLAETEGSQSEETLESYYEALCTRLDVILSFTEHDVCEPTFPFSVLQDLLETQTIESCSHIFSWVEQRSSRLTKGMVPQRGKALVLLRALNDLLRRLSKTGNTTMFCGRILTFLSSIFPLGERSGVNLRGEYGPQWEEVSYTKHVDVKEEDAEGGQVPSEEKMAVDEGQEGEKPPQKVDNKEEEKKRVFYDTFWSLQSFFSRPPLFAQPGALEKFKTAVSTVMPVIKEATVKERAMMGSKAVVGNLKRKRDTTPSSIADDANRNYFFAKFLTSPELLDLEIADTQFRRQFLFQLLILLSHLLQFTKAEKAIWTTPRNRSLHMDFVLEPDDATWVQEMINKVYEEMRQTTPNGRAFAETVQAILEREKNWIRWKNDLCPPFEKDPLPETLEQRNAQMFDKLKEQPEPYKHKLGTAPLTEIWALGYRDLHDLQLPFNPGDVKDFVREIERENKRVEVRRKQLRDRWQQQQRLRAEAQKAAPPQAQTSGGTPAPTTLQAPTPTPATQSAPLPQRPGSTPAPPAASPPLHPSLPAKPGTIPIPTATPVPAQQPVAAPAAPVPASNPIPQPPPDNKDPIIMKAEETKLRLSWLALRIAREDYLHLFGKIGNGDITLLAQEIEKEKERVARGDSQPANPPDGSSGPGTERLATPTATPSVGTNRLPADKETNGKPMPHEGQDGEAMATDVKDPEQSQPTGVEEQASTVEKAPSSADAEAMAIDAVTASQ